MKRRLTSEGLSDAATVLGLVSAVVISFTVWVGAVAGGLAIVAFVVAIIVRRRERNRDGTLIHQIAEAMSVDRVLDVVARDIALGGQVGGWRMSLYELDVAADRWILRGRAASNELYADGRDMPVIRHDQGVLRTCLKLSHLPGGGFDHMPQLPAPSDPQWARVLQAWGIGDTEAQSLRMKSRSYCGAVFKVGPQTGHQPTLGLVAESEAPDGVDPQVLEAALTRPFFESVAEIVLATKAVQGLVPQ